MSTPTERETQARWLASHVADPRAALELALQSLLSMAGAQMPAAGFRLRAAHAVRLVEQQQPKTAKT